MTNIKENSSGQGESIDREMMIKKIYDVIGATEFARYRDDDDNDGRVVKFVMIGDVLDWMYEKRIECKPVREGPCVPGGPDCMVGNNRDYIVRKRPIRRKSIDHQDDFTINYLYQLILSEK